MMRMRRGNRRKRHISEDYQQDILRSTVEEYCNAEPVGVKKRLGFLNSEEFTRRKNRLKKIRTVFQVIILVISVYIVGITLFHHAQYIPAEIQDGIVDGEGDTGFVALSYFGVDRVGNTSDLIGVERLGEHLDALKKQGYVTITQSDIEEYYKNGQPLPRRALFLMFEDGRRDTAIFAQNILERNNYKGTMLTYPEKFDNRDPKFLLPKDLKDLEETGFWEMGTNGFRLEYINVFDRYGRYIGELDPLRYAHMSDCLGRRYNHYLMDYIRDEKGMPLESYRHMKARIDYDYEKLEEVYEKELGCVPRLYSIMHANTGAFGNNPKVSAINEAWTRKLFAMNFNREGYCFNQRNSSIYDLTRMQPQPYWSVNHLLMRMKYDINQEIEFETGTSPKYNDLLLLQGAAEMKEDVLTVTSLPQSTGLCRLSSVGELQEVHAKVELQGNVFGKQKMYFGADDQLSKYISVGIINGQLVINEKGPAGYYELFREKLTTIDNAPQVSVEEDKRAVEVRELQAQARYANTANKAKEYTLMAEKRAQEPALSVEEGGELYESPASFKARGFRQLEVLLKNGSITVKLDDKLVAEAIELHNPYQGGVYLESGWSQEAWSQRNLADDVYDGVFKGLILTEPGEQSDQEKLIYSFAPEGLELILVRAREYWTRLLDAFITYL